LSVERFRIMSNTKIFLRHFVVRIMSLTNCFTGLSWNINSRIPHQAHRTDHIVYFRASFANLMHDTENVNFYVLSTFISFVLLCFKIVERECDMVSFKFVSFDFELILTCMRHVFLYCRTIHTQVLSNDFIEEVAWSKNDSKTDAIDIFYNRIFRIRILNLTLRITHTIVTNFNRFANACGGLFVVRSFCAMTFKIRNIRRSHNSHLISFTSEDSYDGMAWQRGHFLG